MEEFVTPVTGMSLLTDRELQTYSQADPHAESIAYKVCECARQHGQRMKSTVQPHVPDNKTCRLHYLRQTHAADLCNEQRHDALDTDLHLH